MIQLLQKNGSNKPKNFAQKIITLYKDVNLWNKISMNGYKFVKKFYNIGIMEKTLLRSIDNISNAKK